MARTARVTGSRDVMRMMLDLITVSLVRVVAIEAVHSYVLLKVVVITRREKVWSATRDMQLKYLSKGADDSYGHSPPLPRTLLRSTRISYRTITPVCY